MSQPPAQPPARIQPPMDVKKPEKKKLTGLAARMNMNTMSIFGPDNYGDPWTEEDARKQIMNTFIAPSPRGQSTFMGRARPPTI